MPSGVEKGALAPWQFPPEGAQATMATDDARVLTVRQPWAWAIIHGGKDVENRSWPTKHRGPLLIHAGSAFERNGYDEVQWLARQPSPAPSDFVHGAIIGVVNLVECLRDAPSPWAVEGQWHWSLHDPRPITPSYPCTGRLGLWRPPPGLSTALQDWSFPALEK